MLDDFLKANKTPEFLSGKKISQYTKITLFSPSPVHRNESSLRRSRKLTPVFWNVKDDDSKRIKSRTRLDDFTHDNFRHLFPQKSPKFQSTTKVSIPRITQDEKFFNRKIDKVVSHREELIRLRKQGFLIFRNN
jgi:hypothetical protein